MTLLARRIALSLATTGAARYGETAHCFKQQPDQMPDKRIHRRLAAILVADVEGYSRMVAADEAGTLALMRTIWEEKFKPAVAAYRGRLVKLMGDGALVEFNSAVDAVEFAVAFQRKLASLHGSAAAQEPVWFRIGINLGDVVVDGDDIFGDGVNVAARLESQAPRGGILLSDSVYGQVKGKTDIEFAEAGPLNLKNIAVPVRAWRWSNGATVEAPKAEKPVARSAPSIAVLPFTSISSDPEQEYFADGLVEEIITALSKLADLRVIARNSSFVYKGKSIDIREAARSLGVQYVLEGSVRRAGNRIRISAQLIEATDGVHVWAERYDRPVDDIFSVQDEVTLSVATEMQVRLTEGEQARLRQVTTTNLQAWTHWVEGLASFRKEITNANMSRSLQCWQRALELDPGSATLNAMIGLLHYLDARFGWWDDRETAQKKAQDFANRALNLDAGNADANITASLAMLQHGAYEKAASLARHAAHLAPGSADVTSFACFVLAFAGFAEEAIPLGEQAMKLSPFYPAYYLGTLGNAYRLAGRAEDAIALFKTYHAKAPGFGLCDLVLTYQQEGLPADAAQAANELLSIRRNFRVSTWAQTQYRADRKGLDADIYALLSAGLPH